MADDLILGVIPARKGSKRLPNKHVLSLCGKPLIAYTIEAALEAEKLDLVVVSTDDKEIAEIATQCGAAVSSRPAKISTDTAPIDEVLRHVVDFFDSSVKIVVLMQANVPVRKKGVVDQVVEELLRSNASAVVTAYEVNQRPEWMKRLVAGRAVPYMPSIESYRMQDFEKLYLIDGAVYAVRTEVLMRARGDTKVHAYLGGNIRLVLQGRAYSVEIDDRDDLRFAEYLLRGIGSASEA